MKAHIQNILRVTALSLTVALGGFGSAHAAIIKGSFDPAFGAPFNTVGSELGWKGEVVFDLPGTCAPTNGTIEFASCNQMKILSASVSLYDVADNSIEATLNLSPTELFPLALNKIIYTNNAISGIRTDYSAPVKPLESQTFAGINDYYFALGFGENGLPSLVALREDLVVLGPFTADNFVGFTAWLSTVSQTAGAAVVEALYDGVIAVATSPTGANGGSKVSVNLSTYSFTDVTAVPEPESLLLTLGALAALGITTRRRSNKAA